MPGMGHGDRGSRNIPSKPEKNQHRLRDLWPILRELILPRRQEHDLRIVRVAPLGQDARPGPEVFEVVVMHPPAHAERDRLGQRDEEKEGDECAMKTDGLDLGHRLIRLLG